MITFLEDRRALYVPYVLEVGWQVTDSVKEMRQKLNTAIEELSDDSKAVPPLRAMRAACRKFLTMDHPDFRQLSHHEYPHAKGRREELSPGFLVSLGELRATFGYWTLQLGALYNVDIEEELASIFPPADVR